MEEAPTGPASAASTVTWCSGPRGATPDKAGSPVGELRAAVGGKLPPSLPVAARELRPGLHSPRLLAGPVLGFLISQEGLALSLPSKGLGLSVYRPPSLLSW